MYKYNHKKIRKLRTKNKLSVYGFGKRLGGKPNYVINGWEEGTIIPKLPAIVAMCNEFDVEPNYFFT